MCNVSKYPNSVKPFFWTTFDGKNYWHKFDRKQNGWSRALHKAAELPHLPSTCDFDKIKYSIA